MPELPEVETIRRQLQKEYLNLRIEKVEVRPARIFQNATPQEWISKLTGRKIQKISRYGKFLIWETEGLFPVFHLGMSGIFVGDISNSFYPGHIHISIWLEGGRSLFFQDVRKFSKVYLYREQPSFCHLGVDPTKENFTLNSFTRLLHSKKMNIKSFLMNQNIIAGIGNIYANEILFDARVSPYRNSNSITEPEAESLFASINKILKDAIDRFGTTYSAYRTVEGNTGGNQNFLKVYQLAGQPCVRCGSVVQRIIQNSRSTFYCPGCQEK